MTLLNWVYGTQMLRMPFSLSMVVCSKSSLSLNTLRTCTKPFGKSHKSVYWTWQLHVDPTFASLRVLTSTWLRLILQRWLQCTSTLGRRGWKPGSITWELDLPVMQSSSLSTLSNFCKLRMPGIMRKSSSAYPLTKIILNHLELIPKPQRLEVQMTAERAVSFLQAVLSMMIMQVQFTNLPLFPFLNSRKLKMWSLNASTAQVEHVWFVITRVIMNSYFLSPVTNNSLLLL